MTIGRIYSALAIAVAVAVFGLWGAYAYREQARAEQEAAEARRILETWQDAAKKAE